MYQGPKATSAKCLRYQSILLKIEMSWIYMQRPVGGRQLLMMLDYMTEFDVSSAIGIYPFFLFYNEIWTSSRLQRR